MGTDIVDQGYPETLRLAHIMATFTAGDVLAMQAFAAARYGVQLIPKLAFAVLSSDLSAQRGRSGIENPT